MNMCAKLKSWEIHTDGHRCVLANPVPIIMIFTRNIYDTYHNICITMSTLPLPYLSI